MNTAEAFDSEKEEILQAVFDGGHHVVHAAAGSGKTSLAIELVARWVEQRSQRALLLVPTRRRAAQVRDDLAKRLDRTTSNVLVRTPASLAFAILRLRAGALGEPAPTLVSGPEQDQILAELLAGHESGEGTDIDWPASIPPETRRMRAFRDELRDLHMRAAEIGLDAGELAEWGEEYGHPEWVAAGALLQEYRNVMALGQNTPDRGGRFDAASIVDEAVAALTHWRSEVGEEDEPGWDLIVHDDYQDATLATARLLDRLKDGGARLVALGDADLAVQQFRGGTPTLMNTAELPGEQVGAWDATSHTLTRIYRFGPRTQSQLAMLEARLPAGSAVHRRQAEARGGSSQIQPILLASEAEQIAYIARFLRERRVYDDIPFSQMAVVVRSGSLATALRRGLRQAGVPLATATADVPLRDEAAVRPLMTVLDCIARGGPTGEEIIDLLRSPYIELDAVSVRALRRALLRKAGELRAGGIRAGEKRSGEANSQDLLLELFLGGEAEMPQLPYRNQLQRLQAMLAAGKAALSAQGATPETVLWQIWDAAGVAEEWQNRALGSGLVADRANVDLDAIMALFRAAEQYTDRSPRASTAAFIEHLRAQDFPADTLAASGGAADAVAVHTPASAAGNQWRVVVVAGVQEDVWPDLRIRDTLLGSARLAEIATGRDVDFSRGESAERERYRIARKQVQDGELRAFVNACSRAQGKTVVTAVLSEEEHPSAFVEELLDPTIETPTLTEVPHPLDLRGLVGGLRQAVAAVIKGSDGETEPQVVAKASDAAAVLAYLATQGVTQADPATWPYAVSATSSSPLAAAGEQVRVSPSTVDLVDKCALRWMLTRHGGQPGDSSAQVVGNLVHLIASHHPRGGMDSMLAELDQHWQETGISASWVGRRERTRIEGMLARYDKYVQAHQPDAVMTEQEFRVALGRALLVGTADRLELSEAGVRIVDLKTGKSALTTKEALRYGQLGAYQVALEAGAFSGARSAEGEAAVEIDENSKSNGAALVYLAKGALEKGPTERSQVPLAEDEDRNWAREMIEETAEVMAGARFEAHINPGCSSCPVRNSCPLQSEGSRVSR